MITTKSKFLLWLVAFLVYIFILTVISSSWFQRHIDTETYFVWWLIGVFFFNSVMQMGIRCIRMKANGHNEAGL